MFIDVDPIIARIGPFILSWQGIFLCVGIVAGLILCARHLRAAGIDTDALDGTILWVIPSAVVGARLFHVADSWNYYAVHPLDIFTIYQGGASVYGAIVFGSLAALLFVRRHHLPIGPFFDATAPAQALGLAIGRVGSLITGAYLGRPTSLPFGVTYVNPASFDHIHVPVHPAAAYEIVWDLMTLGLLIVLRRRDPPCGILFWTFAGVYALGQIWTGFFRGEAADAFGLDQAQVIGIAFLALSAFALIRIRSSRAHRSRVNRTFASE